MPLRGRPGAGAAPGIVSFEPRRVDWWSSGLQLAGTLLFNVNTFHALQQGLDAQAYDRLVWTPDAVGSACFLASGYLAYVEASGALLRPPRVRTPAWRIAAVNLVGCVAFGISAVAAFWVPSEGSVLDLAAANAFTAFGGLCFLVGAVLLLREPATVPAGTSPSPGGRG
jgi:YrhK-like protein